MLSRFPWAIPPPPLSVVAPGVHTHPPNTRNDPTHQIYDGSFSSMLIERVLHFEAKHLYKIPLPSLPDSVMNVTLRMSRHP